MSVLVTLDGSDAWTAVPVDTATGTVGDLLAAVHAALDLPQAIGEYDLRAGDARAGGHLSDADPATNLANAGIFGVEDRIEVRIKFKHVARERLRALGVDSDDAMNAAATRIVNYVANDDAHLLQLMRAADPVGAVAWQGECLRQAAGRNALPSVALLLKSGVDANLGDAVGVTALAVAAMFGHVGVMSELINHGAHVDSIDTKTRKTPLHYAAAAGSVGACLLLLGRGANIEHSCLIGATPLCTAVANARVGVLRVLLAHGALHSVVPSSGQTPLMTATQANHIDIARMLLERGAHTEATDLVGSTPLHCCGHGRPAIAESLIAHGACLEARDRQGHTPLAAAVRVGQVEMVELLLAHGADVHAKGAAGETLLDIAVNNEKADVLPILRGHMA